MKLKDLSKGDWFSFPDNKEIIYLKLDNEYFLPIAGLKLTNENFLKHKCDYYFNECDILYKTNIKIDNGGLYAKTIVQYKDLELGDLFSPGVSGENNNTILIKGQGKYSYSIKTINDKLNGERTELPNKLHVTKWLVTNIKIDEIEAIDIKS